MADLYPQTYSNRQTTYHRQDQQYPVQNTQAIVYPQLLNTQSAPVSDDHQSPSPQDTQSASPTRDSDSPKHDTPPAQKSENTPQQQQAAKPQATFLTKLYALLERPENHHMIRWDPAGEHIIVERPEQLALHVLPSVYRQSRFASFSRQLNIYGFMRKVNLRNVDPAIDDPDASTWSHPTLNRHSPPEVVANFKRRVPPRLPKPRKRDNELVVRWILPRNAPAAHGPFGSPNVARYVFALLSHLASHYPYRRYPVLGFLQSDDVPERAARDDDAPVAVITVPILRADGYQLGLFSHERVEPLIWQLV
ncbi:hypothetical protein EVJ58_g6101 [Rhodofomes roseus]|uniref:HSF-type DNA-binding domain-containing protein n=1 Tax=Rhodofomes roseus TaxID=34475 RepID=A0A4Y9YA71_9APHY|nr:hypothetical protein EVJ58_g6101 [Rhodofomes roseus]